MGQKLEIRVTKLEDRHSAILEKLKEMGDRLIGMDHVIRGNGSPGLVAKLATHNERIKALEEKKRSWKDLTASVVSGGVVAIIAALLQHFSH